MRTQVLATTVSLALAAGVGTAFAAGQMNLTSQQKQTIQQTLYSHSAQSAPNGLHAQVGRTVPKSVNLQSFPRTATNQVHVLKSHKFAKLSDNKILVVNPSNRKIDAVINEASTTGSGISGTMGSSRRHAMTGSGSAGTMGAGPKTGGTPPGSSPAKGMR